MPVTIDSIFTIKDTYAYVDTLDVAQTFSTCGMAHWYLSWNYYTRYSRNQFAEAPREAPGTLDPWAKCRLLWKNGINVSSFSFVVE